MYKKNTILVVDDDEDVLDTTCTLLDFSGYVVEKAKNGFEAIAKCKEFSPDLVFVDAKMPDMDGYETITRLKNQNPSLKVVLMTANADLAKLHKLTKNWDVETIEKPYTTESLKQLIERHFAKN